MKRFTAAVLALVLLFSFSACGKVYFDEDEYNSEVSKASEKASEEASEQASKIEEGKSEVESEMGKTEENKKLVLKYTYTHMVEYVEYTFGSDGMAESRISYKYYDNEEDYEKNLEQGDTGNNKLIDHDDSTMMLEFKSTNIIEGDYESYYNMYGHNSTVCEVVE